MKIGIITIHNVSNYGAVLQSYALKEIISKRHVVFIIDYDNRHVSKSLDIIRIGYDFHSFLGAGKDILRLFPRVRVIKKFNKFIKENMNLIDFQSNKLNCLDVLISGSDQIWNPLCVSKNKEIIPEYFLSFANDNQKKISYASSCGSYIYNDKEKVIIKQLLSSYSNISVREYETSTYLDCLLGTPVSHVLDPTLLLKKDEWLSKLKIKKEEVSENKKYILLYVIKKTDLLKKVVAKIKKDLGLKVILVNQGLFFDSVVDSHIRDAGPVDFISYVNNASFIITDSFHGTTFSIIFNKPFVSVSPGKNINRISSLLAKLHLESRIVYDLDEIENITYDIDFDDVNERLNLERKKSIDFIYNSID
ncbi:polysaccharide pyruvyl transferase family protein [Yersinia ruckeri]|uniref:polysaccharide pyruvyl transferase family protein n=1 Tax=Yersinia ruckeri TaxID=29486 RepID=UPI0005EA81E6|nr:polysaccharide pyruvyl transferase family protein [Yersinia ruckeri]AKA39326.1 hypothetical protein UGYR_13600 [Yersinia ruckeri]EKN4691349.1 polysaccharide pyruvyl transferase family protein [Yersinia ruckeri]ELM3740747.1 polysaccharide pyruvyl transferase family protein [Yersinia ruckeri]MCK8541582.1 polysaccharide pyruvyl transferase family protein [Yersinia ruckeri]MCK8551487.1 polysaccharide pyruvyl transferase family protein [Yersinia ruckeri]